MKRHVKAFLSVVMAIVVCLNVNNAMASTIKELKTKQTEAQNEIKEASNQLSNIITDKNNTLYEFSILEAEMEVAANNYYYISDELEKAIAQLEQTEQELLNAQQDYAMQFEAFGERVRVMYESGSTEIEYLEILLKSKSFSEFLDNITIINSLIEFDKTITERLKETEETIAQKLIEVENHKIEIESLKQQQEIYMAELDAKIAEKNAVIEQLYQQEDYYERVIKENEEASQSLELLIKQMEAEELERQRKAAEAAAAAAAAQKAQNNTTTQTTYVGGQLGWPVPTSSTISSYYGNRTHPITKKKDFHSGIDIPESKGKNVVSAGDGKVSFAGNYGTYGKLVLIDHGGGITTAYAHNSAIVVKVGDTVKRGQTIAKIGSTGQSTGPHCHFEVRVNGSTKNPLNYVKK